MAETAAADAPTALNAQVLALSAAGDVAGLERLIQSHKEEHIISAVDEDGSTALHWAAFRDQFDVCRFLVDHGAALEARTKAEQHTPLMWAAINGHLRVIHFLIEHAGASLQATDVRGYNVLHHAVQNDQTLVVHYFVSKGGLDIEATDSLGHTPLMWASYQNHEDTLRYLINRGARLDCADHGGSTALHWAALKGHVRVLKVLLAKGADATLEDKDHETALNASLRKGFPHVARTLTEHLQAMKSSLFDIRAWTIEQRQVLCFVLGFVLVSSFFVLVAMSPYLIVGVGLFAGFVYLLQVFLSPLWLGTDERNPVFISVTFFAYLYSTVVYFLYCLESTAASHPIMTLLFIVSNFVFFLNWLRLLRMDPGWITADRMAAENHHGLVSEDVDMDASSSRLTAAERGEWEAFLRAVDAGSSTVNFCVSCNVRRPLRSKHCKSCHKCVAKFDHHCQWINQCVGVGNLAPFMFELILVMVLHASFIYLSMQALMDNPDLPTDGLLPLNKSIPFMWAQHKFWVALLFFHVQNLCWQSFLTYNMIRNIATNTTMNESMNRQHRHRYSYLYDATGAYRNPFDRGVVANLTEFFAPRQNWFATFDTLR